MNLGDGDPLSLAAPLHGGDRRGAERPEPHRDRSYGGRGAERGV